MAGYKRRRTSSTRYKRRATTYRGIDYLFEEENKKKRRRNIPRMLLQSVMTNILPKVMSEPLYNPPTRKPSVDFMKHAAGILKMARLSTLAEHVGEVLPGIAKQYAIAQAFANGWQRINGIASDPMMTPITKTVKIIKPFLNTPIKDYIPIIQKSAQKGRDYLMGQVPPGIAERNALRQAINMNSPYRKGKTEL